MKQRTRDPSNNLLAINSSGVVVQNQDVINKIKKLKIKGDGTNTSGPTIIKVIDRIADERGTIETPKFNNECFTMISK
jgi:uncharacterized Zn ribbon protein